MSTVVSNEIFSGLVDGDGDDEEDEDEDVMVNEVKGESDRGADLLRIFGLPFGENMLDPLFGVTVPGVAVVLFEDLEERRASVAA